MTMTNSRSDFSHGGELDGHLISIFAVNRDRHRMMLATNMDQVGPSPVAYEAERPSAGKAVSIGRVGSDAHSNNEPS